MKKATGARRPAALGIVNPAKLSGVQRDSVCAQCHLTGAARIARAATKGRSSYAPGDDLSRTVAVFVWNEAKDAGFMVTSHFETLNWSRCKQASGDRLWCGTCHQPHGEPVDVRRQCITCHAAAKSCALDAATRLARNNDQCQACHMPKSQVRDAEHAVYTDHSLPRRPSVSNASVASRTGKELVPFWRRTPEDERDLALAYATAALTDASVRGRAFELLKAAETKDPADLAIAAQLAQFYDRMRQPQHAIALYERVLAGDPANVAAVANLGTLYAQSNRLAEAVSLWQRALKANPAQTQVRMNLAVAQIRLGDREAGIASLEVALAFDPDNAMLRQLIGEIR
jgi:hypothetical protein